MKKFIPIWLVMVAILYIASSLICASFNPAVWSNGYRQVMGIFLITASFILAVECNQRKK